MSAIRIPTLAALTALLIGLSLGAEQPGRPTEGIQVHGHWRIEIFEADGTKASSHEFENGYVGELPELLGRLRTVGLWEVVIADVDSTGLLDTGPCVNNSGGGTFCSVAEPLDPSIGANVFKTLMMTVGNQNSNLVLSGSATAAINSNIEEVRTTSYNCAPSIAPANCISSTGYSAVTRKVLASPIPVASGQIIQVTVTLSFS